MNTLLFLLALAAAAAPAEVHRRPVTVDDLMRMRSITDIRIAPDGERVAFVVSTPSLTKNEHEAALFIIDARGRIAKILRKVKPAEHVAELCAALGDVK